MLHVCLHSWLLAVCYTSEGTPDYRPYVTRLFTFMIIGRMLHVCWHSWLLAECYRSVCTADDCRLTDVNNILRDREWIRREEKRREKILVSESLWSCSCAILQVSLLALLPHLVVPRVWEGTGGWGAMPGPPGEWPKTAACPPPQEGARGSPTGLPAPSGTLWGSGEVG